MVGRGAQHKPSRASLLEMADKAAKIQATTQADLHEPSPGLILYFRPSKFPWWPSKMSAIAWGGGSFAHADTNHKWQRVAFFLLAAPNCCFRLRTSREKYSMVSQANS